MGNRSPERIWRLRGKIANQAYTKRETRRLTALPDVPMTPELAKKIATAERGGLSGLWILTLKKTGEHRDPGGM